GAREIAAGPLGMGPEPRRPGFADQGRLPEVTGVPAVLGRQGRGHDLVEQGRQGPDEVVEGTGDQNGPVPRGPMLADPPDRGGGQTAKDTLPDAVGERPFDAVDRGALEGPV